MYKLKIHILKYDKMDYNKIDCKKTGIGVENWILRNKDFITKISWGLFVTYLLLLAYFLFFSERYGRAIVNGEYRYNLILFKEIKRFVRYRRELGIEIFIVNIIGNVFAFSPFGFFLPVISRKNRNFLTVILLSLELTLSVETIQLIFKVGSFDVDDILLNTIGAAIGYILFVLCYKLYLRRGRFGKEKK